MAFLSDFKFITDAIDAFHIVRHIRRNLYFPSQVTDMVVDGLAGIVTVVLLPDQVQNHFIGVHASGVLNK